MKYSIAFFSEIPFSPATKILREDQNMRTDLAWMCSLDTDCYTIDSNSIIYDKSTYDIAMVIVPKYNHGMQLMLSENFDTFKGRFKKVVWVQEGPADLIHDFEVKYQFLYLELLKKFDLLLCHSNKHLDYFNFLSGGVKTDIIPTLMITDLIKDLHKPKELKSNKKIKVLVSGNIGNWYHALDSYIIIKELSKRHDIAPYCVSMGRKHPTEQFYTNYKYLPYVNWKSWMQLLNNMDIGLNITRRTGAETFNLNCMYLGIPVLKLDNLENNKKIEYSQFEPAFDFIINNYDMVSNSLIKDYDVFYNEDVFLYKMKHVFSELFDDKN